MNWGHVDKPRRGDHKWWVTNNGKFKSDYPDWKINYGLKDMLVEIHEAMSERTKQYA